uniref:Peptidase M12B propeptide domain-containing protein n=1 Tax=Chelonoidis abingdonii TaxID=106734 RepID=A0A8C0IM01_CHEAB
MGVGLGEGSEVGRWELSRAPAHPIPCCHALGLTPAPLQPPPLNSQLARPGAFNSPLTSSANTFFWRDLQLLTSSGGSSSSEGADGSASSGEGTYDPILRNTEEYRLVVPVSTDSEGRFLSNLVSGPPRGRFRRDAGDMQLEASNEQIFYNITVFGREFHLKLRLNSRLVAPGATIEWQEDSNVTHIEPLHGNCLYVGDITDLPNASVAISNCDGLVSCFAIIPNITLLDFPIVCVLKILAINILRVKYQLTSKELVQSKRLGASIPMVLHLVLSFIPVHSRYIVLLFAQV